MPAPTNDDFANATVITGSSGSHAFDLTDATTQATEDYFGGGYTVWFAWTAPSTTEIQFDTMGSDPDADTYLMILTGSDPDPGDLTYVAADDDSGPAPEYASVAHFTPSTGVTYYIQVDAYAPNATGLLNWGAYVPPPPAPTASTWAAAAGRPTHEVWIGDDIIVTGTDLDTVTDATVGGFSQLFTATSSTHLTIHTSSTARSGNVTVSNASGSATATGTAHVLFPGHWVQPPDQPVEVVIGGGGDGAVTYSNVLSGTVATTQPDFAGVPLYGADGSVAISAGGHALSPQDWFWIFTGGVLQFDTTSGQRAVYMPQTYTADPDAWTVDFEAAAGSPVTDATLSFNADVSGIHAEDSAPRVDTEDLWQLTTEFRRLGDEDWSDGPRLTGNIWPTATALAALPLDAALPVYGSGGANEGAPLVFSDHTGGDSATYTDGTALLTITEGLYFEPVVVDWDDFGDGMAWAVALSNTIDGTALTPPVISPTATAVGSGVQTKQLSGYVRIKVNWTYRPPRYRFLYEEPPLLTAPPLRQLQRDDVERQFPRNGPTSIQASARQGPRGTYL